MLIVIFDENWREKGREDFFFAWVVHFPLFSFAASPNSAPASDYAHIQSPIRYEYFSPMLSQNLFAVMRWQLASEEIEQLSP